MSTITIKHGDSISLSYKACPEMDLSDFGCDVSIFNSEQNEVFTTSLLDVSQDTFSKVGLIAGDDTDALPTGVYVIQAVLYKDDYSTTFHTRLLVRERIE